ncbi:MAG: DUF3376 domain-containing protein [Bryobacteraceae bacterium]
MDFEQEIRFALVLYGGASLAVYIHGVTLEFFHLVRSTAADSDGNLLLTDAELSATERVYRKLGSIAGARFLVDIASGTSAGGINAIFLVKALANGQSLNQLSRLWVDQADAHELFNQDKLPRSLLSSETMHARLLEALAGMEPGTTPLQAEIDVFITATDLEGLELPIELADKTVFEKRHRNVLHFRFGDCENDFARERNPFLASAAQATSAFPFAFEPVCVQARVFSDGGCLDNKPFSYAVQALSQRSSDLPVVRKLMYIEPSPDDIESDVFPAAPNFIRNTLDALVNLPRDETIREDLQRVVDRNRLIRRVQEITSHVGEDVTEFVGRVGAVEYQRRTLADEIRDRGASYAGYHRLKVRAVTDDLAAMLGQPSCAVDTWRRARYSEQDPERSESRFLLEYDLGYRERRMRFLLRTLADPAMKRVLNRIAATLKGLRCPDVTPEAIADRFRAVFIRAAADAEACLDPDSRRIFDQFEYYDQIVFPIFYEASVGEAELCEVFRLSPRDATSIVDENAATESRRKLAGTALFHFGAFLNREWRQNDLMWGRLDAAERIIRAVLPLDSPEASALIHEANLAIVGSEEALTRLRKTYEVDRKLPVFTRLKLSFAASRIILRMLAGYFISARQ